MFNNTFDYLEIDALTKKYIKKAKRKESITAQRGRPSWARQNNSSAVSTPVSESAGVAKRRLSEVSPRRQADDKRTKVED